MLLAAVRSLNVDLSRSVLVGDRLTDHKSVISARLPLLINVFSGHVKEKRVAIERWGNQYQLLTNSPSFKLALINTLEDFLFDELQETA